MNKKHDKNLILFQKLTKLSESQISSPKDMLKLQFKDNVVQYGTKRQIYHFNISFYDIELFSSY